MSKSRIKLLSASAIISMIALALPASAAHAAVSAGASVTCDPSGVHCVATEVAGAGAGTTVTSPRGYFAGACKAETTGALTTSVTCSAEGSSRTVSLPGPNGASAVLAPTDKLTGHVICWKSTGFFVDPLGGVIPVTDEGCAIVTL
jgi:hypothetical protein